MKFKRFFLIACILMLTINNNICANAAVDTDLIQPYYLTILKASATLNSSGSSFTAETQLTAKKQCDLSITMKLQKKSGSSWTTVKTWSSNKNDAVTLKLEKTYTVSKGTYRVSSTVSAGGESATVTSASKTY